VTLVRFPVRPALCCPSLLLLASCGAGSSVYMRPTASQAVPSANKQKIVDLMAAYKSDFKAKYTWPKLAPEDGR